MMQQAIKRISGFYLKAARHLRSLMKRADLRRCYRFGRVMAVIFDESSIQLATARKVLHKTKLLDVTKIYVPRSLDSETSRKEFIVTELDNYIKEFKTPFTRLILGVGGPESALRHIELPKMSRRELDKAVYWEGDKRIPFGLDSAYYGYHLVEPKTKKRDISAVALLAISNKEVDWRMRLLGALDISAGNAHHELDAIGFILPYVNDFEEGREYVLINIKKECTYISFYRGRRLEFMHISSVGSETIAGTSDPQEGFQSFTETLIYEIQNSLDYYVGQFSTAMTELIFVYGDLSYSDELMHKLSNHFGIEFRRFPVDNFVKAHRSAGAFSDQISVCLSAVGLAVADHDMINLLPPDLRRKRESAGFLKAAVPLYIIFAMALLWYWMSFKSEGDICRDRLTVAERQIDAFKDSPAFVKYNQIKADLAADRAILRMLEKSPTHLYLNLKEISRLAPMSAKLDLYELRASDAGMGLVLTGRVAASAPPPEVILAEFIARLDSSPFFKNVVLERHLKTSEKGRFAINFQISAEAAI